MNSDLAFLLVIMVYLFAAVSALGLIWALDAFLFGLTGRSFLKFFDTLLLPH